MLQASSISNSSDTDALKPLLNGEHEEEKNTWWEKVFDVQEARKQFLFSMPMILTNLFYYFITMVSVMLAGHLGDLELAGAALANSWATATGFAFMTGLSGALETLCGQGFGAKLYGMMGVHLQASCIISFIFSVIISIFWWYTESILIFLHQDPQVSKTAALYMRYLIPGLFAYGFLHNILRFLQTQSVVMPLVMLSLVPLVIHVGLAYVLVYWTTLGLKGAPLAASISLWICIVVLALYVNFARKFERTWTGFSRDSFRFLLTSLRLAVPSAAMVCLEFWAFEILVFLAGLMPNAERTSSVVAICVNTEDIAYMITYGLSAAASTRVSNELGAGNPSRAKNAMAMTLKLSFIFALIVILALGVGHNLWASFFTSSPLVVKEFVSMTPFLVISIIVDSVQGVLSGVVRGCGWQQLVAYVNLATFYLVGLTVASFLGFKLHLYAKGLWIGLICGLLSEVFTVLLIMLRTNWATLDLSVQRDNSDKNMV